MKRDDFLVEIQTEELPPKSLLTLAAAFHHQIKDRLQKADFLFDDVIYYATPRRLAVLVKQLAEAQPDQAVERKGPALSAAFDASGNPSPACIGFARSCGMTPDALQIIKTDQGEWVGYKQTVTGKTVAELLPTIVEQAITALPIAKRMRWGDSDVQFVRPVQSIMMLYGDQVMDAIILGKRADRVTCGHRFHAPADISIPNAAAYAVALTEQGHVIADFAERRAMVKQQALECVKNKLLDTAHPYISSDAFWDEVTGLVEWPVGLCGQFDETFLALPQEVLISSMQDHQRYFPVVDDKGKLLPYFVTTSNIQSHDVARVIHGNERVLRARLSDAAFFYETDKKETLASRTNGLKEILFQAKLGSIYDKTERVIKIAAFIAKKTGADVAHAERAALLAKTDLTTNMVGEFPELQGVMGRYYAANDKEHADIVQAMDEQYMPRFAGDKLPANPIGQVLALADRIDTLTGAFAINQMPTGDKDPYGLRRAAIGVLRILIEGKIDLDLKETIEYALSCYQVKVENQEVVPQLLNFLQERLRAWYQDQGITPDVFAAVAALGVTNPFDIDKRIRAVQAFKKLNEAETLSVANKRVSNILTKYQETIAAKGIDPTLFEHDVERILAKCLEEKSQSVKGFYETRDYDKALLQLAELRQPIDDFFDQVMVMAEDKALRENRLLLLGKLRALFLQVADIALLQ